MNSVLFAGACAAAAVLAAAPAGAAVIYNFAPAPAHSATPGFTIVDDFSTAAGLVGSNFQIKTPPSDANGAPPANSYPAGTPYLSVLTGGSATYSFGAGVKGIEFDWGSIDKYNTLTIGSTDGSTVVIPGSDFINASDGNQTSPGTNGLFTISGTAGETFTSVTFASSGNSFEVDNLAIQSGSSSNITLGAVPEPAAWALMIVGFGGVGAMLRRRRGASRPVAAATA